MTDIQERKKGTESEPTCENTTYSSVYLMDLKRFSRNGKIVFIVDSRSRKASERERESFGCVGELHVRGEINRFGDEIN